MLYWTLTHRTVTNLAVTVQIGVNEAAPDIGLITPRDQMWMNVLAGITIAMLIIGWTYAANRFPVRLPQQTDWFHPPDISNDAKLAEVKAEGSSWNDGTDTLVMKVRAKNVSSAPITVKEYIMAMTTFVNGSADDIAKAGPKDFVGKLEVEPNEPIAPGETKELTLKISNAVLSDERLIPTRDPQQFIAGLIRFAGAGDAEQFVVARSSVLPTQFRAQYLPGM
jgi:methane/ammonia monooxygenase subunit B